MIRVLVSGFTGRMGTQVVKAVAEAADLEIVGGFSDIDAPAVLFNGTPVAPAFTDLVQAIEHTKPDVLVDFTAPSAVEGNLRTALPYGIDCVVGTTGLATQTLEALSTLAPSGTTLFVAPNFTTGAVLMMEFAKVAAKYFPDAEVIEFHHNNKVDAPSGTAIKTAHGIAAARAQTDLRSTAPGKETELPDNEGARGTLIEGVPVHSVRSDGYVAHQEVIFGSPGQTLTLRHDSIDRASYMPGVLLAIRSVGERSGLIIGLENLMDL